ncbi:Hypothetical protein NTJ_10428 [Nesidiocoris tenuis]|uniref:Uncharacterized protein n=1 Tax=Nesidiocoris tenuis TaxID=355587 RepID=A0ABN7AZL2_9HEMI|nr:Hypothetical protein NTJ_10428 [Nesidiocoris tenuis]
MNVKLDAVRNYENILKAKENALNELFGENLIFRDEKETNFQGERGDFVKYSNSIGARCDRRCFPAGDFSTGFDESQNGKFSIAGKSNLSEENDRLKFESRQQRLKIDVLTRRCTALELALGKNTVSFP